MTPRGTSRIGPARTMAHAAIQLPLRAVLSNLPAQPDDSHTNFGWADGAFRSHPLRDGTAVELTLDPLTLRLSNSALSLHAVTYDDALQWLDERLDDLGYAKASDSIATYDLPAGVTAVERFTDVDGLGDLQSWYDLSDAAIEKAIAPLKSLTPGPGPVRCWPHHFDLASYVQIEPGDPETARGIGIGLSPGDGYYEAPYIYVNPWPHPAEAPLPEPASPGHWHLTDFIGQIATADALTETGDVAGSLEAFLTESVATMLALFER